MALVKIDLTFDQLSATEQRPLGHKDAGKPFQNFTYGDVRDRLVGALEKAHGNLAQHKNGTETIVITITR